MEMIDNINMNNSIWGALDALANSIRMEDTVECLEAIRNLLIFVDDPKLRDTLQWVQTQIQMELHLDMDCVDTIARAIECERDRVHYMLA